MRLYLKTGKKIKFVKCERLGATMAAIKIGKQHQYALAFTENYFKVLCLEINLPGKDFNRPKISLKIGPQNNQDQFQFSLTQFCLEFNSGSLRNISKFKPQLFQLKNHCFAVFQLTYPVTPF